MTQKVALFSSTMDGLIVTVGKFILSFLVAIVTKQMDRKNFIFMGITPLVVFLLTIPYQHQFSIELSGSVLRSGLNFIYPFAYSPGAPNWIFWGHTLLQPVIPAKVYLVLTFVSISFFIASYVGMYLILTKIKRGEGLMMLAISLMPFLFWSFKENAAVMDLGYSFFKLLTFAVPMIVIGLFVFLNDVMLWIQDFISREKQRPYKTMYKVGYQTLHVCVWLLVLAFGIASSERVYRPLTVDSGKVSDRLEYAIQINNSKARAIYQEIAKTDKKILLVSESADLGLWWSTYYGRNHKLYSLVNMPYFTYIGAMPKVDVASLPHDLEIVYAPGIDSNTMVDNSMSKDVAMVMKTRYEGTENVFVKRKKIFNTNAFSLLIYAKEEHVARLEISVELLDSKPVTMKIQNESITINKSGTYGFKIDAKRGAQEIVADFSADTPIQITDIVYGK